jgi:osmotically-inducible protein OsmY
MAQDRRREQYGYDEGSWGEEDRRFRSGRSDDWQRRNEEMRRREWGQSGQQGYGRGFEDYGRGRDAYSQGGDREVDAEIGRGRGFGQSGGYGQTGYGGGTGSGQQYGYGSHGWRGESGYGTRDWQQRGRQGDQSYGGYGGYGSQQGYGGSSWSEGGRGSQQSGDRGMWDRASDEVASWFGDDDARRRREMDQHRGKGPKNYTRSDERIKEEVCDNLAEHPMVDASEIEVKVQGGEVTLDGTVHSRQQRRAAEDCVERISGIKHLQNNLRVQDSLSGSMGQSGMGQGMSSSSTTGSMGSTTATGMGSSGRSPSTSGAGSTGSTTGSTHERK